MKVFLADFDLFRLVGGGQTFYRSIIVRNPHIDFYYLRRSEPEDAPRPENAHVIDYVEQYNLNQHGGFQELAPPRWTYASFDRASNIAFSVAGRNFDVVDLPDYEQFGIFLAPALREHGVDFERIALSMHGRITTTIAMNWLSEGLVDVGLQAIENLQYAAVDTRYFISPMYRDEWRAVCDLDSYYIDPMWFFSIPEARPYNPSAEPPDLNFIGRSEKRKGPHLFLQIAWWLPRGSFHHANIIGPESFDHTGVGSSQRLLDIARPRLSNVYCHRCMTPAELAALYATKSITILPSQYDTLNLTAMESLFAGCPTAVGDGAGVCRYLAERFPDVPFETIPMNDIYACIPRLEAVLANYDTYRAELHEALCRADYEPRGQGLEYVYSTCPAFDHAARTQTECWYEDLLRAAPVVTKSGNRLRLVA